MSCWPSRLLPKCSCHGWKRRYFLRNPYLCYTEHGLHTLYYTQLFNALTPEQRYLSWAGQQVCVLQKAKRSRRDWSNASAQICSKEQVAALLAQTPVTGYFGIYDAGGKYPPGLWFITGGSVTAIT